MAAVIVTWAVAFVSRGFPCFTPTLDPFDCLPCRPAHTTRPLPQRRRDHQQRSGRLSRRL